MRRSLPRLLFPLLLTDCTLLEAIPVAGRSHRHTIQPYAAIKIGPIPDLLIGRVAGIVMVNVQIGEAKP